MQFAHDTPVAIRIRGLDTHALVSAFHQDSLAEYRAQIREDMAHRAIAIDENEFLKRFLNHPDDAPLSKRKPTPLPLNPFAELETATDMREDVVSAKMKKAINDYNLVPGMKFCLSEYRADGVTIDERGQKVDGALYDSNFAPVDGRPHWADHVVTWEFKQHLIGLDPFDDKAEDIQDTADSRKKVRGQIISYAELVFALQHRVHLFMILIIGRNARLLRWDRSGVVVSKSVDYYVRWEFFCLVLWRISVCHRYEPSVLGADPTATRVRPNMPEWKMMEEAAERRDTDIDHRERVLTADEVKGSIPITFEYVRKLFRESLRQDWPRYMLEVPDKDTVRKFLVARPYFQAKGMAGRGTRGYVALDCTTWIFRWLKDAWRGNYESLTSEGEVLETLNELGVGHVPTVVCHGDLAGQETLTPKIWEEQHTRAQTQSSSTMTAPSAPSSSQTNTDSNARASSGSQKRKFIDNDPEPEPTCPLRRHRHYRIVVEEVCINLASFRYGDQLLRIILDAMTAHRDAYKNGYTHRDVSAGNILFLPRIEIRDGRKVVVWRGFLADWEMSKPQEHSGQARQPERTGTWQFMSIALLDSPSKVLQLPDELEAFFYVILYHAVRYLESNIADVGDWIERFFDHFIIGVDGSYQCGSAKQHAASKGQLYADLKKVVLKFNTPMDGLLAALIKCIQAHYIVQEYEEEQNAQEEDEVKRMVVLSSGDAILPLGSSQSQLPTDEMFTLSLSDDEDGEEEVKVLSPQSPTVTVPTEVECSRAAAMSDHKYFMRLIRKYYAAEGWSRVIAMDRIDEGWLSRRPDPVAPCAPTHKKRRTHGAMTVSNVLAQPDTPTKPRVRPRAQTRS